MVSAGAAEPGRQILHSPNHDYKRPGDTWRHLETGLFALSTPAGQQIRLAGLKMAKYNISTGISALTSERGNERGSFSSTPALGWAPCQRQADSGAERGLDRSSLVALPAERHREISRLWTRSRLHAWAQPAETATL
ncbi:unnamed protein product [Diplocarpon coronariae]|uniref:Uncharacterized protein n=1 Tax=Diplocarpon coronariae TaxID=2795749 RepID=A0A218YXK6_9HELO|nr:hypothetical protein JHW43_003059 [Diplocarpon mali]OWP00561.1 hypothetical protein B2J93_4310 [Marssonina coronariae]